MIKNKYKTMPIADTCGQLRELYRSKNLSIAHLTVKGKAKEHKHHKMEEVYYIEKGKGYLIIGELTMHVREGDTIKIPKRKWHSIQRIGTKPLGVLVITRPGYDPKDVILKAIK